MRIKVQFRYDQYRNCNVIEEVPGGGTRFYKCIQPESVIELAGGAKFFARPIKYQCGEGERRMMICLVQIKEEEALLPIDDLREIYRGFKGNVLKPNMVCLLAMDGMSLSRGLVHPFRHDKHLQNIHREDVPA